MIYPNALITKWERCTGDKGSGRPALEEVELQGVSGLPCEVGEPGWRAVQTLQARGVQADRSITIPCGTLAMQEITPDVQDRVTVKLEGASTVLYEVVQVDVKPAQSVGMPGASNYVLTLRRTA